MRNRASSYFLIVVAGIFSVVQCSAIVEHVRLQDRLTTPDYLNAIKIALALVAIVIAIRSLRRDKSSTSAKPPRSPLSAPRSFAEALTQVTASSIRHPVLTPLLLTSR